MTIAISGVKIPDSKITREAAELVRQYENDMLFNHSVRVFVFGAIKGHRQNLKFDSELLYIAALFHDLGLVDHYHTQTKRFEVEGADAAREFLRGTASTSQKPIWFGRRSRYIRRPEFHNTCGRKSLSRMRVCWSTSWGLAMTSTRQSSATVTTAFPRGDFKNEFLQVQICSALKKPQTTFGTVNFDYIEDHDPTFHKPNACTRIRNTPRRS